MTRTSGHEVGCLVVNDLVSGRGASAEVIALMASKGVLTRVFKWDRCGSLHGRLQTALHEVNSLCRITAVAGVGTGCWGALALAEQLNVDRLLLMDDGSIPARLPPMDVPPWQKQLYRLAAYARRNISFCVSDALLLPESSEGGRRLTTLCRELRHGRTCLVPFGEGIPPKEQIYTFLCEGEFAKSLAENAEMCIIYE